jgi:CPA2 family monovalent cation:H+ antiporter-2
MPHDTGLIVTIAAGLALAFVFGWLATRLKIPALVGYLLAGVVLSPNTPGYSADLGLAGQLAEIGVILLMFGVGLHFSLNDLMNVRRVALPGAIVGMIVLTIAGTALASVWGWSTGSAITFGLCICISSTVVVIRAFEQRNALDTGAGKLAVGWMIVEDLVMVVALVMLPALAPIMGGSAADAEAASQPLWMALGFTLAKVFAFSALMYFVGRRTIPWLLWQVARIGSRELFTLSVLSVALGIAVGAAALFGVSFALGAFFAGVIISESELSHQAAADALPLRDAFAVLFFVSVGMLFDPGILIRAPFKVLAVVAIVMLVKPTVSAAMLLLAKRSAHNAVNVGASLGEIGEFSFILAGLAVSLGLLTEDARSLILAAAILSISFNPLLFALAPRAQKWLQKTSPQIGAVAQTTEMPVAELGLMLRDHAIIVGYGRVGSLIGRALAQCGVPFAIVEQDRQLVERLRLGGINAVYGDAARVGVLALANPAHARLVVVATPDPFQARRVVEIAREAKPDIDIVVRTHSTTEQAYFEQLGVGRVVMGEHELALGMAHYAVMSLGHGDDRADEVVQQLRGSGRSDRLAIDISGATAEWRSQSPSVRSAPKP